MALHNEYKIRQYDWHDGCGCFTSVSLTTKRVGTGDDAGLFSNGNTVAIKPGQLDGNAYNRTDLTVYPQFLQDQLAAVWTDAFHASYENYLRD